MSVEVLVFFAVVLGVFVGLAGLTYIVLTPVRLLGFGPQGGVGISVVFAFLLLCFLATYLGAGGVAGADLSWSALLALPLCFAGLLFLGVGLPAAPRRTGERRDRVFVGVALIATGIVTFLLGLEPHALFSDIASSVSNAPGP
jgi:hypothetical protein